MASYNGVQAAVLSRPGCRLILAKFLLTSKNILVAGNRLSMQLLSGLVQGMSVLGPRGGLHCGTRGCLQVTLPVSCTVTHATDINFKSPTQRHLKAHVT